MNRLGGKVAAVTGAASGIGQAVARGYIAEGAHVAFLDLDGPRLESIVEELGTAALAVQVDVSHEPSVAAAFAEVDRRLGRLDVLFNCAGVQLHGEDAPVHQLALDVWERTLAINLTGVYLSSKHGIPLMRRSGGGSVINCGSPTGLRGNAAGYDAYSASKGGVMALTRVMAVDYGRDRIRVNNLVPGATLTPLTAAVFDDHTVADIAAGTPLGRLAGPEDYVGLAVYLASDESSFATGQTFIVDGGATIR